MKGNSLLGPGATGGQLALNLQPNPGATHLYFSHVGCKLLCDTDPSVSFIFEYLTWIIIYGTL